MIGDSENDAASAHAAGLPLILMRYGYARIDPAELGAAKACSTVLTSCPRAGGAGAQS